MEENMRKPLFLLLSLSAIIFAAEAVIMIALEHMPPMATQIEVVADAALLTAIVFPVLYYMHFKPLQKLVADLKKANRELYLAEAVFTNSNEAIIITDSQNNIIRTNSAFTKITKYHEDEVIGINPRMLSSGKHEKSFYQKLWHSLENTGTWNGEIWDRKKDGICYPAWLSISVIRDSHGVIQNHMAILSDKTLQKKIEMQLLHNANHDPLTDLPNRILLQDRMRAAKNRAIRENNRFAVLFVDLDYFKSINDNLGHAVGDRLLQHASGRMRESVRDVDTIARVGGDEFVIILQDIARQDDVIPVIKKLISKISHPFIIDGHTINLSASIGCTYSNADLSLSDDELFDQLLYKADTAMYKAKQQGRNRYSFYDDELAV